MENWHCSICLTRGDKYKLYCDKCKKPCCSRCIVDTRFGFRIRHKLILNDLKNNINYKGVCPECALNREKLLYRLYNSYSQEIFNIIGDKKLYINKYNPAKLFYSNDDRHPKRVIVLDTFYNGKFYNSVRNHELIIQYYTNVCYCPKKIEWYRDTRVDEIDENPLEELIKNIK